MKRRLIAAAEVVLAAAVVIGHNLYKVLPNEVLVLVVVGGISLLLYRQSLPRLGFRRPQSWPRTLLIALGVAIGLQLLSTYATAPLIERLTHKPEDLSDFRLVIGNVKVTLIYLALIWSLAAFGEEFVYRGYILNRMAEVGGGSPIAWWVAVLGSAALFGIGHAYQGPTSIVDSAVTGLVLGTLYVASGRNLWICVLTHGLSDTIGLFVVWAGWVKV